MFELVLNCLCRSLMLDIISVLPSHGHPLVAPLAMLGLKEQLVPALGAHKFTRIFVQNHSCTGEKSLLFFFFKQFSVSLTKKDALAASPRCCLTAVLCHDAHALGIFLCFACFCRILTSHPLNSPSSSYATHGHLPAVLTPILQVLLLPIPFI